MDESRIKDVGALLSAFFDEEKLRRGSQYAQFFESWRSVVGERLAAHSRVVDLDKGILIVEAEHPGWIQLLQLRQTKALEALAKRFPDLAFRGIAFRLAGQEYRLSGTKAEKESADNAVDGDEPSEGSTPFAAEEKSADVSPLDSGRDPDFIAALSSLKKAIQSGKGK
jgi:hypothetical protein